MSKLIYIIFIEDFINIMPDHRVIFNEGNDFFDVEFQVVVSKNWVYIIYIYYGCTDYRFS